MSACLGGRWCFLTTKSCPSSPPEVTGEPISRGQQQVATVLAAGLADPAAIIAVTGEPGLGKTVTVANTLRSQGLNAWIVLPAKDDLSMSLALLNKAKSLANFVLVIEDAHALSVTTLRELFLLLERHRAALPRVVFVGRPAFWRLFDDPALIEARRQIRTVAVLFPMDRAESERFLRQRLGATKPYPWTRTMLDAAQGNPALLRRRTAHLPSPPERDRKPERHRSFPNLSGPLALLVLGLATAALALTIIDVPVHGSFYNRDNDDRMAGNAVSPTPQ